ncbi:DNA polymerase III subunit alpha [Rhizobium laguerreae]|uniref:DNA polymerase III subunit alpha n=1 Tax=Rhizobium laguerreae TaxID=1076926 RepID=UPI001C913DB9|nr:DNA polymerase III subunit alpha [Rhizobium laguerreae]MBY3425499.1 DNA polymerase III subunit alpha [Rhizobium laguerreae]
MLNLANTFIHLRLHTSYSLCSGMISNKKLGAILSAENVPAVAVSDRNNLFGGFEFSQSVSSAGVQPIVGAEVSLSSSTNALEITDNVVLLCQSYEGYVNLSKILSDLHLQSVSGTVSLAEIENRAEGLICLWGGGEGLVSALPELNGRKKAVDDAVDHFLRIFGDRFYIEIQRCGEPWERLTEPLLLKAAYAKGVPVVATNDVYYIKEEEHYYQDILQCIGKGEFEEQEGRPKKSRNHYLRSPDQMLKLFADLPEALSNTIEIARRCHYVIGKREPILPVFPLPPETSADAELLTLSKAGLDVRFRTVEERVGREEAERLRPIYDARLQFEFDTISRMGFSGYYLIVSDFMTWSTEQKIPVGMRGSGATSIVAWCMNITHLDPIRFGLVFERFLNPERVSLPDFDVDLCQKERPRVIEYVREKYGRDAVAQIITFGTLQAKAAIRDVGRVIQAPFPVVDKLAKLIGDAKDLKSALEGEEGLRELLESDALAKKCFSIAQKLEGQYRHASTHAAGVIISDRPLVEYVPLYKDPSSDMPVTQFQYKDAESAGLVKFDFLGLRTLTIIASAIELVHRYEGIEIDILSLDFEDPAVFQMLANADTTGVFQLESPGMRDLVLNLKPTRIDHLIALISLYRPGPMDSIPSYIRRATGEEEVEYDHPMLASVLEETYGIITYQEDVMRIARELGGYTLGEADLLRRAMGKKIASEMEVHEKKFCDGAQERGIDRRVAKIIFEKCAKFAGYGFNKGHAAAYSQVAYQTAFLKAKYPVEFYCACMTVDIEAIDRLKLYSRELKHRGIELLAPSINDSLPDFSIERMSGQTAGRLAIRYGLAALKNVGIGAARALVDEREARGEFLSIEDFFERISSLPISKSVIVQLIKAGALDAICVNRGFLIENIDRLYDVGKSLSRAARSEQGGLFSLGVGIRRVEPEGAQKRPQIDDLSDELVSIGFYLSGHPLDQYRDLISAKRYTSIESLRAITSQRGRATGMIPCLVQSVQVRRSKRNGNKYGFVVLSDHTDEIEVLSFSQNDEEIPGVTQEGKLCVAVVEAEVDETRTRFSLRSIQPLETNPSNLIKIRIHVPASRASNPAYISSLRAMIGGFAKGRCVVELEINTRDEKLVTVELPERYSIDLAFIERTDHDITTIYQN